MKSDLNELERCARIVGTDGEDIGDNSSALAVSDPSVTLALIAHIRELRAGLEEALGNWNKRDYLGNDVFERRRLRELIAKELETKS